MKEFAAFTDAERIRAIFQDHLPRCARGPFRIAGCQIMHAALKTFEKEQSRRKSHLSALYRLELVDDAEGKRLEQLLYSKTYLDSRSRTEFVRNLNSRLSASNFHVSLAHLPELDTVVWCFPNDPALPMLADVVDPGRVLSYLPYDRLPAAWDAPEKIREVRIEIVNYRPERRCIARYEIVSASSGERAVLFGKTYREKGGEEVHRRMAALGENGEEDSPAGFRIPRPFGYGAETGTVWMEALPGSPLIDAALGENGPALLRSAAAGLAAFQRASLGGLARHAGLSHLEEAEKKTRKLETALPEFGHRVRRLFQRLAEAADALPEAPETLLHGDFHIDQLRVCNGRIALFDFDELCLGDPLQDAANFLADLHVRQLDPARIEALSGEFLQAYASHAPWPVSPERLHWLFSLQLLTKAYRAYWQQKSGHGAIIERCLARAERRLPFSFRGGRR